MTKTTKRVVITFDICSSSNILQLLKMNDQTRAWTSLLQDLEKHLLGDDGEKWCEIYKFMGDGWIIFADPSLTGNEFLHNLNALEKEYLSLFDFHIKRVLETEIDMIGMTYGVDYGEIIRVPMIRGAEMIGRPLNNSARLQSAIKDGDTHPAGKILISPQAYDLYFTYDVEIPKFLVQEVHRKLRNVNNDKKYLCRKISIMKRNPVFPRNK